MLLKQSLQFWKKNSSTPFCLNFDLAFLAANALCHISLSVRHVLACCQTESAVTQAYMQWHIVKPGGVFEYKNVAFSI